MPRGDRTGPNGMGPMTGRRGGYCAGNTMQEPAAPAYGRGMGLGRGGRGTGSRFFGRGFWSRLGFGVAAAAFAMPDAETEKTALKNQAEAMQQELEQVRRRLEELEEKKS